mmetsp:Transcript_25395/g.30784  ORF Transcript_25395/g.30784 Transcript_25395/m.30784 type:complete len:101 (+) Transcript_25395:174-476(+)
MMSTRGADDMGGSKMSEGPASRGSASSCWGWKEEADDDDAACPEGPGRLSVIDTSCPEAGATRLAGTTLTVGILFWAWTRLATPAVLMSSQAMILPYRFL